MLDPPVLCCLMRMSSSTNGGKKIVRGLGSFLPPRRTTDIPTVATPIDSNTEKIEDLPPTQPAASETSSPHNVDDFEKNKKSTTTTTTHVAHSSRKRRIDHDQQRQQQQQQQHQQTEEEEERPLKSQKRASSQKHKESISDLLRQRVEVPGPVFHVHTPGYYFIGDVKRRDPQRATAVEVVFRDDQSLYWFPISDVRGWLKAQREREQNLQLDDDDEEEEEVEQVSSSPRQEESVKRKSLLLQKDAQLGVEEETAEEMAAQALTEISGGSKMSGQNGPTMSDAAAR